MQSKCLWRPVRECEVLWANRSLLIPVPHSFGGWKPQKKPKLVFATDKLQPKIKAVHRAAQRLAAECLCSARAGSTATDCSPGHDPRPRLGYRCWCREPKEKCCIKRFDAPIGYISATMNWDRWLAKLLEEPIRDWFILLARITLCFIALFFRACPLEHGDFVRLIMFPCNGKFLEPWKRQISTLRNWPIMASRVFARIWRKSRMCCVMCSAQMPLNKG